MQAALVVCILLSQGAYAQPDSLWSEVYGTETSDDCLDAIQTAAGDFVMVGYYVNPFPDDTYDFEIVKADAEGNQIWQRRYGRRFQRGNRTDEAAMSVIERSDGSFLIGGTANIINDGDFEGIIMIVSADGDSLWSRRYGGERITRVFEQPDGGFVAAGRHRPYFWLFEADSVGEVIWEHIYNIRNITYCDYACRTPDGGYMLIGSGANSMQALKVDSIGEFEWISSYRPDTLTASGSAISSCSDGGYILTGFSQGRNQMCYSVRIDEEGEMIWDRIYGRNVFRSTAQVEDGGFVFAGETNGDRQGRNGGFYLVRTNSDGEPLWETAYGHRGDRASSVMLTSDGGYALAGVTDTYHYNRQHEALGGNEFWLVRTGPDPVGNGVALLDPAFPSQFAFSAPYPNPFNSTTTLQFALPSETRVSFGVFDLAGRKIEDLLNGNLPAGDHKVIWNAGQVPAGTYFVRLEASNFKKSQSVILLK
jgi:hypothetical protein